LEERPQPVQPMGQERRMGKAFQDTGGIGTQRVRDDRLDDRPSTPAQCRRPKKEGQDEAIGRSKGGLSTKIHALADAFGYPLAFLLTAGQAHDLVGADALLPKVRATALIADKAYDVDKRVIEPLIAAGKAFVIPPTRRRLYPRPYDKQAYKIRHYIENFYCKLKQYRAIATRYDKTARNFLAAIHLAAAIVWLN
jgi:transposase